MPHPDLPRRGRAFAGTASHLEAVIFASAKTVSREILARVVGKECIIGLVIDDLVKESEGRPYELVAVAGGLQHRTRPRFARTIRASLAPTLGGR